MNDPSRQRSLPVPCGGCRARLSLLATVAFAVLGGCTSLPPDRLADGEVELERVDSPSAHVERVRVLVENGALEVAGSLVRPFLQRGRIPGHLYIEALDGQGTVLGTTGASYHRRSVHTGKAWFFETLQVDPDDVRKIRVIHHGLSGKSSC
jgi:hypothetical protein